MLEIVYSSKGERGFIQLCVLRDLFSFFRGLDLIFCVEPYISVFFLTDIKSFFNLDKLEPTPGRSAPELEVEALKIGKLYVLEQAPVCPN